VKELFQLIAFGRLDYLFKRHKIRSDSSYCAVEQTVRRGSPARFHTLMARTRNCISILRSLDSSNLPSTYYLPNEPRADVVKSWPWLARRRCSGQGGDAAAS